LFSDRTFNHTDSTASEPWINAQNSDMWMAHNFQA